VRTRAPAVTNNLTAARSSVLGADPGKRQYSRVARFLRREPFPSGVDLAVYATK